MPNTTPTRREILRHGSVGLIAAALPAALPPALGGKIPLAPPDAQAPKLDVPGDRPKKLNWAVVGLGELALGQVLPAFALSEKARPYALVSGHTEKAAKVAAHYGIDPKNIYDYENFDTIANDPNIDVVYIILPNTMHAEYTIRALKAGKHVLCEKPMAPTEAECLQMIDASKSAGKKLMIAYRLHYEPYNLKAVDLLRSGAFGKIQLIEASNLQTTVAPNIRLSNKTAGGPVGDLGIYCLNAVRYLTGEEPIEVSAMLCQPPDNPNFGEVAESVTFQLRFPSGVLAMCGCGFGSEISSRFRVNASSGWLQLEQAFKYSGQRMISKAGATTYEFECPSVNQFAAEMDHFCTCIRGDRQPKTPGEEGLRDVRIIDAIKRAAWTGNRIKVEPTTKA